jgi:hypothetical protein
MATLQSSSQALVFDHLKGHKLLADVLQVLPQTTVQHNFVSLDDLQQRLTDYRRAKQQSDNQFIIFLHVPKGQVLQITDDSTFPLNGSRISYERTTKILIIKIPHEPHEVAKEEFANILNQKFAQINLSHALRKTGSTTRTYGNWIKEPDASWEPKSLLADQAGPSLVLEVGLSEAAGKLRLDARGWIEATNSQTRIVITVRVMREIPRMIIQIWERAASTPPRITRQYHACAIMRQEIQISYNKQTQTISIPGNMTLTFQKIFLRPIDPTKPIEQDIVIRQQELEDISREVWEAQGFM